LIGFGTSKRGVHPGGVILPIAVPGPGQLRLYGRGLQIRTLPSRPFARPPFSKWIEHAGRLELEARAAGPKPRTLAVAGGAQLDITVRFTPQGGVARTLTRKISLRPGA
jgi:hypothetical protein